MQVNTKNETSHGGICQGNNVMIDWIAFEVVEELVYFLDSYYRLTTTTALKYA